MGREEVGRVLLCDDALGFPLLFGQWMSNCGIDLIGHADNGDDSVALAGRHRPDVIVVDHLLGDITSKELAPRLRAAAPEARLLLISGMHEEALAEAAEAAGVDAHLGKGARPHAMCDVVRSLLASARP